LCKAKSETPCFAFTIHSNVSYTACEDETGVFLSPIEDKREAGKRNQAKWDKCRAAIIQDGGVS
jgi:hypothetical protein